MAGADVENPSRTLSTAPLGDACGEHVRAGGLQGQLDCLDGPAGHRGDGGRLVGHGEEFGPGEGADAAVVPVGVALIDRVLQVLAGAGTGGTRGGRGSRTPPVTTASRT
ncbi:hypothetical protein [Streptomyces sp. NPDC059349]|uniref:hypothetical protein n=1 Tax=Streptomyces sp. NPDC059349 TaxID=3346808 RepID=UPI0036B30ECE